MKQHSYLLLTLFISMSCSGASLQAMPQSLEQPHYSNTSNELRITFSEQGITLRYASPIPQSETEQQQQLEEGSVLDDVGSVHVFSSQDKIQIVRHIISQRGSSLITPSLQAHKGTSNVGEVIDFAIDSSRYNPVWVEFSGAVTLTNRYWHMADGSSFSPLSLDIERMKKEAISGWKKAENRIHQSLASNSNLKEKFLQDGQISPSEFKDRLKSKFDDTTNRSILFSDIHFDPENGLVELGTNHGSFSVENTAGSETHYNIGVFFLFDTTTDKLIEISLELIRATKIITPSHL